MKIRLSLKQEQTKDPQKEDKIYDAFLRHIWQNFPTAIWAHGKDCYEIEI